MRDPFTYEPTYQYCTNSRHSCEPLPHNISMICSTVSDLPRYFHSLRLPAHRTFLRYFHFVSTFRSLSMSVMWKSFSVSPVFPIFVLLCSLLSTVSASDERAVKASEAIGSHEGLSIQLGYEGSRQSRTLKMQ